MIASIAISTVPASSGGHHPVLQALSGGRQVLCMTRLRRPELHFLLPTKILDRAIAIAGGPDVTAVLVDKTTAKTFAALPEAWQRMIISGLPADIDGTKVIPIPGGAWKIMIILQESGRTAARAYRVLGRQAHTTQDGQAIWLPAFDIDPVETDLPDLPEDLRNAVPSEGTMLAISRWFWTVANPSLADPFLDASHPELAGVSELSWVSGSHEELEQAIKLILWSDPLFAACDQAAEFQVGCLIDPKDGPTGIRMLSDVSCDDRRARRLLARVIIDNQPVCHRMRATSSRVSGLVPASTALSVTVNPPSAHQAIAAIAGIEDWAAARGLRP